MRRLAVFALTLGLIWAMGSGLALAQEGAESPTTTTKAPLRPFDPPLPEPVFIPDLVSDLVVTDFGSGLEVSPLTANPESPVPGVGVSIDWKAWGEFALPAVIPLMIALGLVALTRIPRRSHEDATASGS